MRLRLWRLLTLMIFSKPVGNLFLAIGITAFPHTLTIAHPAIFVRVLLEPMVATGIALQILWLLSRMAVLSVADLNFVVPVTAIGYVLTTALGRFVLHEDVSRIHWLAVMLIFLGTALVASTAASEPAARAKTKGAPA